MAIRRTLSLDFSRYPTEIRKILEQRKTLFEKKLGAAFPHTLALKDMRRLFEVTPNGTLAFGQEYSRELLSATSAEHVKKASSYLERSLKKENGKLKNPFSHLIVAMNILRPDITPLAFKAGESLFTRMTSAGIDIKPFISLNDFSFVADFYRGRLRELLPEYSYNSLHTSLKQRFGPHIDWKSGIEKVPFSRPQTDHAVTMIYEYIKKYMAELSRNPGVKASRIAEVDSALSGLEFVKGKGIEFAFAPKDLSFYRLGKLAGDCSAVRHEEMEDKEHENIFYDVPLWLGMPNYQVLQVFYNGEFAMKFHLVIGMIFNKWTLIVDASETIPGMRDDVQVIHSKMMEDRDRIFIEAYDFIKKLGKKMHLPVLANRFSCNLWLMEKFKEMPFKVMEFASDIDRDPFTDTLDRLFSEHCFEMKELTRKFDLRPHIQVMRFDPRDEVVDGYKVLAIIDGFKGDRFLPLRGV